MLGRVMEDAEAFESTKLRSINILKKAAARKASKFTKWKALPFRLVLEVAKAVVGARDDGELDPLVSIQLNDAIAGFAKMLSKAVNRGFQLAFLRTTRTKDEQIAEAEIRGYVASYVPLYTLGDPAPVEENRVYLGD